MLRFAASTAVEGLASDWLSGLKEKFLHSNSAQSFCKWKLFGDMTVFV